MHDDASPDGIAPAGDIDAFRADIAALLPIDRLVDDPLRRLAYGTDASFYRLIPQLVLKPDTEDQVAAILSAAARHRIPLTFRAAGTSLSGQAITDSVLVQIGRAWAGMKVEENGAGVDVGPAAIGGHVNAALKRHGRRFGPDPASIDSAHVGGIVANNAGGMVCGTTQTSYATVTSMRILLADGTLLDTADMASREAFSRSHKALLSELAAMRREVLANIPLAERIARKFSIKNTCGYSLNALIDFEDPINILTRLMVGSEGTLGFMSRIRFRTVADPALKSTALVFFPTMRAACEAAPVLKKTLVDTVELMDRSSLRSVEGRPGIPREIAELGDDAAALLIETRADDEATLASRRATIKAALSGVKTLGPITFSEDPERRQQLWAVRKGAFPSAGAMRAPGTSVIIEDIAVTIDQLPDATAGLRDLCNRHGYPQSIIWGHVLEGNVHFVITPDFSKHGEIERYDALMDDLTRLIVKTHDGSLKAEHGTGRNMAPFVEMEWGSEAFDLMRRIKLLLDPEGILNPDVLLTKDTRLHLRNIKPLPVAAPLIDKCIECGFCESVCPSAGYTLTPRQRIVGLREIRRLEATGEDSARLKSLKAAYPHQAIDSCAVDSLCATACPVGIDTGAMMKVLRIERRGRLARWVAARIGRNFATVAWVMRKGLGAADMLHRMIGTKTMSALARGVRRLSGNRLPFWTPAMPGAGGLARLPALRAGRPRVVYFPSCASRAMGPARADPDRRVLSEPVVALLDRAGFDVVYPPTPGRLCCGQPFESKGLMDEATHKASELEEALWQASRQGRDPVVFDTSPCAMRAMRGRERALELFDLPDFLQAYVLPYLTVKPQTAPVALHVTCSTIKRGAESPLATLAAACAPEVIRPTGIACCGWSGERGFMLPELNANALASLSGALPDNVAEGVSSSRTCEIGLSLHSDRPYRHIAYLLERCSRPQD